MDGLDTMGRDTISKGRIVQGVQYPRNFSRGPMDNDIAPILMTSLEGARFSSQNGC